MANVVKKHTISSELAQKMVNAAVAKARELGVSENVAILDEGGNLKAAEPSLHRRHARQASGRVGRSEEGGRHRRPKCLGPTTVVEAAGMAPPPPIFITADRRGELSHGGRGFYIETTGCNSGAGIEQETPNQFHAAHETTGPIVSVRDAVFVLKEQRREKIASTEEIG